MESPAVISLIRPGSSELKATSMVLPSIYKSLVFLAVTAMAFGGFALADSLLTDPLASPAFADALITFQGNGADTSIAFDFFSLVPLDTPGILATSLFLHCDSPRGETCYEVEYNATHGLLVFVAFGVSIDERIFEFPDFVDNGTYSTLADSAGTGTLTVMGSTKAVAEPASLALAAFGGLLLLGPRMRNSFCKAGLTPETRVPSVRSTAPSP